VRTAVLLLNFGEPEHPSLQEVVPFLQRIFQLNVGLEEASPHAAQERTRQLAEARAPGLLAEYELIGGSPLLAQARTQAELLERELGRRGHDAVAIVGMQFTPPFIADAVKQARAAAVDRVIALPVYPLAGPSTTVAALHRLRADVQLQLWSVPIRQITGWHRHSAYVALRSRAVQNVLRARRLSFADPGTKLVFAAHGTPMKYIREGSRYEVYVRDICALVAAEVGAADYVIGYQNHTNRPIDWTQPDIEHVIDTIDAAHVIVDAVSFMHEQSETLAELDHELRHRAEARGLHFHRVPIPYAAPEFIALLADLCESFLDDVAGNMTWQECRCQAGARCLNADIDA
jgi:protoporphyrin/coproporphyrin ferrochelatase